MVTGSALKSNVETMSKIKFCSVIVYFYLHSNHHRVNVDTAYFRHRYAWTRNQLLRLQYQAPRRKLRLRHLYIDIFTLLEVGLNKRPVAKGTIKL
jgi:hypothetical protein